MERDVHDPIHTESLRQFEAIRVDVGDDHEPGPDVASDRRRHEADRTRPGDEHVLTDEVERQRRVCGVAERVEDRRDVVRDVVGQREDVLCGNGDVFGEGTLTGDADADVVVAEVAAACPAVAAVATGHVPFDRDTLTHLEPVGLRAEPNDLTGELVTDHHRHRDRLLCPLVPFVDVQIGAADRCLRHPDEDVTIGGTRDLDLLHPQSAFRPGLDEGLHATTPISRPMRVNAVDRLLDVLGRVCRRHLGADARLAPAGRRGRRTRSRRSPRRASRWPSRLATVASPSMTGMIGWPAPASVNPARLHPLPEQCGVVRRASPASSSDSSSRSSARSGRRSDDRSERVGEEIGPAPLPEPSDDLGGPARVSARGSHRAPCRTCR